LRAEGSIGTAFQVLFVKGVHRITGGEKKDLTKGIEIDYDTDTYARSVCSFRKGGDGKRGYLFERR
jgi:hypothetical protein